MDLIPLKWYQLFAAKRLYSNQLMRICEIKKKKRKMINQVNF